MTENKDTFLLRALPYYIKSCEFQQELFGSGVVETNGGLCIFSHALHLDDLTTSEPLMLNDAAWRETMGL